MAKSNEPICLDDSDEEKTYEPQAKKSAAAALKSNETIEIDLSDDDGGGGGREEKKEESVAELKQSANAKSDDGFVDLT